MSDSEAVRRAMATELGYEPELWQRICSEMYWQAIHLPEELFGGMGLGYVELVAMMEQMGRYLLCSPFFSTVCLAGNALLVAGSEEQKAAVVGAAVRRANSPPPWHAMAACSRWGAESGHRHLAPGGRRLSSSNGDYRYVIDGHSAQTCWWWPRARRAARARRASALFLLPSRRPPGSSREWLPTMDQARKQAAVQTGQTCSIRPGR